VVRGLCRVVRGVWQRAGATQQVASRPSGGRARAHLVRALVTLTLTLALTLTVTVTVTVTLTLTATLTVTLARLVRALVLLEPRERLVRRRLERLVVLGGQLLLEALVRVRARVRV